MALFEGLSKKERREKKAELERLVRDSVSMMPKTKDQISEYLKQYGFYLTPGTIERYAIKYLDYTTYGEIRTPDGGNIIKPFGTHYRTKLFLPKDPNMKERAVQNLSRYR